MFFVTFTTEDGVTITLNASLIDNVEWFDEDNPDDGETRCGRLTRTDGEWYELKDNNANNAKLKKALGYED